MTTVEELHEMADRRRKKHEEPLPGWLTSDVEHYFMGKRVVTIVTMATLSGELTHGVAICSPEDEFDPERGEMIARGRACCEIDGTAVRRRERRAKRQAS